MDQQVMYQLSYGLFVLTSAFEGRESGCIINTAGQVTSEPNRISITVNKSNFTHDLVKESGQFNLSILSELASFDTFKHFGFQSGREVDKFARHEAAQRSANGLYYITAGTNGFLSAAVEQALDLGTHTLFIAGIDDMELIADAPPPPMHTTIPISNPSRKRLSLLLERLSGGAECAAIFTRAKTCQRISSARCVNTLHQILKKQSCDQGGLSHPKAWDAAPLVPRHKDIICAELSLSIFREEAVKNTFTLLWFRRPVH